MPKSDSGDLIIKPLMPSRVDDVKTITHGSWGAQCWDLHHRFTAAQQREMRIAEGPASAVEERRREVVAKLARRKNTPMLVAYVGHEPAGFVSLGPRSDYGRVARSKATPPVDDVPAWVIPCITVRPGYRRRGVAVALLRAAVDYARKHGAPAIEGYPRTETKLHDDLAFIGTEAMFKKAGYRRVRGVMTDLPRGWAPRVAMRAICATSRGRRD